MSYIYLAAWFVVGLAALVELPRQQNTSPLTSQIV